MCVYQYTTMTKQTHEIKARTAMQIIETTSGRALEHAHENSYWTRQDWDRLSNDGSPMFPQKIPAHVLQNQSQPQDES